jgi:3-phosphoshikimate 1-carboxyvinyltransferase
MVDGRSSSFITVRPPSRGDPDELSIRPPGSKSISNRALLLAAMAEGKSVLEGMLDAEDTRLMLTCLHALGVRSNQPPPQDAHHPLPETLEIEGRGRKLGQERDDPGASGDRREPTLEVGTAGTVARFLTAALCAGSSRVTIDGSPRMRERPMAALMRALHDQGARFECEGREDALPLRLLEHEGLRGGSIELERPRSSQFVSALLLSALWARSETKILLHGGTPARPYVDMTLEVMRAFGGRATWTVDGEQLQVDPGELRARKFVIEPDASAASYWLSLAAIYDRKVRIPDLGSASLQGDAKFHEVLARFGAHGGQDARSTWVEGSGRLVGCDLDLTDMPDMTLSAAVVAAHAEGPTTIEGVAILRHHESDRLAAGARELRKLGCGVEERESGLRIEPPSQGLRRGVPIDTYLDHRMAMAFALAGDVHVNDPVCINKTYPRYFEELARLGMCDAARAREIRE